MAKHRNQAFGKMTLSVAVQVEEERPAVAAIGEPELVASGSFRVDARRMLEKVRAHAFIDERDCLVPWLRCAAASGATRAELEPTRRGFELRFDGRPIPPRELEDPLQGLAGQGEETDGRARQFAFGLLAVERLAPSILRVVSGGPAGQASLTLTAAGIEAPPVEINRGEGTQVGAEWSGLAPRAVVASAVARLREHYGLSGTELWIAGSLVRPQASPPGWHVFDRAGFRGGFRFEAEEAACRVALYHLGAFVQEVEPRWSGRPVRAALASDAFGLDLAQASVVQDERFEAALAFLAGETERYY